MPYLREINNGWKNENMKKFGAKPEFFSISDKTEVSDTLFGNSLKIGGDSKLFAILKICLCETFLVSLCVIWFLLNTFPDQQFSQKYV